jgi:hypothetical protein
LTSSNTTTTVRGNQFNVTNAATTNFLNLKDDGSGHIALSVNQLRATTGNEFALVNFSTYRSTDGINYTPTQSGDIIGGFKFNGNANTSTSPGVPAGPGAQITATATETWTTSANGTKFTFNAIKTGTITDFTVISGSSDNLDLASTVTTIKDVSGNALATINSTAATFTVPVTTEITSATVLEGTTYTPAATVDNNISVQLNANGGGTTVIDLASLTGNSRGGSYNILVYNNTGSGAPIQVKNVRKKLIEIEFFLPKKFLSIIKYDI